MTAAPAVTVRLGSPLDLRAVAQIEQRSFSDAWSLEALYGELCPDNLRLPLVAELEDEVCGYLMAWRVVDQLHILNIAADPQIRRRGIGSALLVAAAREASASGLRELTLEVRRSNQAARAFYRGHGLSETGLRPGYYTDTGEDAIIMAGPVAGIGGE